MNWDEYFLEIADVVRRKSKDPSSQIGALIVGSSHQIVSTGFNGFPRGIDELELSRWERPIKYKYVTHAECNAIHNAARTGVSTEGCTLYLIGFGGEAPVVPCIECSKACIQAGIVRVVGRPYKDAMDAWIDDLKFAKTLLVEAGVECVEYR